MVRHRSACRRLHLHGDGARGRAYAQLARHLSRHRANAMAIAPYKQLASDRITLAFCWAHLRHDSLRSPSATTRRSPSRPSHASQSSMRSRRTCVADAPTNAAACAEERARPLVEALRHSWRISLRDCPANPTPPKPSAMPSIIGTARVLPRRNRPVMLSITHNSDDTPCEGSIGKILNRKNRL